MSNQQHEIFIENLKEMQDERKLDQYAYDDYSADRRNFTSEEDYLQWCGLL